MQIEVRNVTKRFERFPALHGVSLTVEPGEFVALLGPSGSGKTTLLRIIAGLDFPNQGQILFGGEDASNTTVGKRQVGFVFQQYALFRHMTVFDNVAFGLRIRPGKNRPSAVGIKKRVLELLTLVQIDHLVSKYPSQLSGGQRQRVALARALAIEPRVLLLDEPFGALDAKVRKELRRWLRGLHDEMGLTSVFVTHDQEEAMEMADRVVVMDHGTIVQTGKPADIYGNPRSPFVFEFLGNVNRLECRLEAGGLRLGPLTLDTPEDCPKDAIGDALAYVRPHDMLISRAAPNAGVPATVAFVSEIGPLTHVELKSPHFDQLLDVEIPHATARALELAPGMEVHVIPAHYRVFLKEA